MPPAIFSPGKSPTGAPLFVRQPPRCPAWALSGVTRDSNGNPLSGCVVHLFRTSDNVQIDQTVSNGSGVYSFTTPGIPAFQCYIVAYLPGSPDVAGTTVNTLAAAAV